MRLIRCFDALVQVDEYLNNQLMNPLENFLHNEEQIVVSVAAWTSDVEVREHNLKKSSISKKRGIRRVNEPWK